MKVLLVDNHPATRLGMKILLNGAKEVETVGEAGDAEEALRLNEELHPDLVVLDPELGMGPSGLEVCRRLKSSPHPPKILVYTAQNSKEDVAAAALAGADAYLYKGVECEKLPEAVDKTCNGERTWLLGSVEESPEGRLREKIEAADLTPKESEILALLIDRHSNGEIAEELCLSLNTVKTHVSSILKKLGLGSRKELFKEAHPEGVRKTTPPW